MGKELRRGDQRGSLKGIEANADGDEGTLGLYELMMVSWLRVDGCEAVARVVINVVRV